MKVIKLGGGKGETIVDDDVYKWASWFRWYILGGYVNRSVRTKDRAYHSSLHREILGLTKGDGKIVDHINGNPLDNRRNNLRLVTFRENARNRGLNKGKFFKGVVKIKNKWMAQIVVNYQIIYLGCFPTEEQAARAYDEAAKKHFGEFAHFNFSNPKS